MSLHLPPYPPPRYAGENGEVSATLRRADQPPDHEAWGIRYSYLASRQSTGGDFGLYRVDLAPAAGGPGPHFHRTISESFFVLSGRMRLHDGRDWVDGRPGDYLYVPPGGVHGFRNEADEPASILMLFTPGAPREFYFEGLASLGEMTDEQRREFFDGNDNFFV
jgi:mannose-6-phosphate isomerase-like protein (cupin superfamily)